jgi:acetyltransferase
LSQSPKTTGRQGGALEALFEPRSVAVVGASAEAGKTGHEILTSLVSAGFEGPIYPVNPRYEELEGLTCYPSLGELPEPADLAVIVVPAKVVPSVVQDAARSYVRALVIVTSGFKETGRAGAELERNVIQTARRAGIRVLGPNCLGVMAPGRKLNASFGGPLPPAGHIAYFSQSGSLLAAIADMGRTHGVGFSKLLSIGNKADIDELTVMRAFGRDGDTAVIAGYLETISDGDAFVREAERISRTKPILLMKSGETGAGAAAASSHTGRLAETERAVEVVFERAGVIRCESVKAQFDYARAFASQPLPAGPDVAVICNAGGPGIMATDAIERQGLALAELSETTRNRLAESLPEYASVGNPIDVLGDALADRFQTALSAAMDDDGVHTLLVLLTPHAMTEIDRTAEAVARAAGDAGSGSAKPVLACFLGGGRVSGAIETLRRAGIPTYDSPEAAVAAIRALHQYARWRNRPKRVVKLFPVNRHKVGQIVERDLRRGEPEVSEMDAMDVLDAYGFLTPEGQVATTADQAANYAQQIGFPVVLKIWSPDIVHKAEVDGVKTGLNSPSEVRDAFDLMMYRIPKKAPEADILGVLVQRMVTAGQETILGMQRDPRFGPLMMFGLGGAFVEVLRDVAFYLAPITGEEAREMLTSTRTYRLLQATGGSAGSPRGEGVDIEAIAEALQRLSQLATEFPQIQEMDINPFMVGPEGTPPIAVDARILLREEKG